MEKHHLPIREEEEDEDEEGDIPDPVENGGTASKKEALNRATSEGDRMCRSSWGCYFIS